MSNHIYGGLSDPLCYVWNLAWAKHALLTDPLNLYHSNRLYPLSYSFATTYQPIPLQLIFMPFHILFGNQVWATNATLITTFVLCGFTMFLLIFYWTKNIMVSCIAGCIFAFSPVRLPSEQLTLLAHFWSPLAVLFLDRYFNSLNIKSLLWCAVFCILQIITAIETGFFLIFILIIYTLFIQRWELLKRKRYILYYLIGITVFITGVLPFIYPYQVLQKKYGFGRSFGETIQFSADPVSSYLRAKPENRLYHGMRVADEYSPLPGEERLFQNIVALAIRIFGEDFIISKIGIERLPGNATEKKISLKKFFDTWNRKDLDKPLFQGFLTMILGLLGALFLRKHPSIYYKRLGTIFIGILVFGFVMSLGPVLILYGHLTYLPLPYLIFYYIFPGFSVLRGVYRFMFMVSFGLSVLGGFGMLYLEERRQSSSIPWLRSSFAKYGIGIVICCIIMAESWSVPVPMAKVPVGNEIPGVYQWLSKTPIEGALFEIPTIKGSLSKYDTNPRYAANRKMYNDKEILYLYYSTYHFKKIVNGVGSFLPPERQEVFYNLYKLPDSSAVKYFKNLHITTFILHTDKFEIEDARIWTPENIKAMGFKEVFRDGQDIVLCF